MPTPRFNIRTIMLAVFLAALAFGLLAFIARLNTPPLPAPAGPGSGGMQKVAVP